MTSEKFKNRPHILRVIQQYSIKEYWNHPTRKMPNRKKLKYHKHNNNAVLNDL
jgi:hypothetical protein